MQDQTRLLSHLITSEDIKITLEQIQQRIKNSAEKDSYNVDELFEILNELKQFDFGRYLLQNKGLNGYWTHYMLTHPWNGRKSGKNNRSEPFSKLESFLLNRAPTVLATQQRFEIFLKENQEAVKEGARLACIPCGMMGELLYLDYKNIKNIDLVGIDYDQETFADAQRLADKMQLSNFTRYIQKDAWNLGIHNQFDLISSNGLNIYEPDFKKVTELFRQFYLALKPGGKLVTSFLTLPPSLTDKCEWDFSQINMDDLLLQKTIFSDLVGANFRSYCSSEQVKECLTVIGFSNIQFKYDKARLFPTIIASKE